MPPQPSDTRSGREMEPLHKIFSRAFAPSLLLRSHPDHCRCAGRPSCRISFQTICRDRRRNEFLPLPVHVFALEDRKAGKIIETEVRCRIETYSVEDLSIISRLAICP